MMIQRIIILAVCSLMLSAAATAQVEMAVAIPVQQTTISQNTYHVMRSRLLGAITAEGVASAEYSSVVLYPEISFTNKQVVESGMRNVTIVDMQLTLIAEHIVTGTVFHSQSMTLRGEGTSIDQAVMSAMTKLSTNDRQVRQCISTAKQKIVQYFQDNANALISKARNMAKMKQYAEAITLLESYPASLSGYAAVSAAMMTIYQQYQTDCCSQLVQQARSAYALGDYQEAALLLQTVDMQSSCASEAKALCQKIKNLRDAEAARAAAAYERRWQAQANLEKLRIQAVRDVAVAYCKRQTKYYFVW